MTDSYEDRARDELLQEARERDLSTSGTRQELVERLREADREADEERPVRPRRKPMDLARRAARQLAELTGRPVDGVSGFSRTDHGWRVTLEVVEVSRVPSATDVLGCYEVVVDEDGDLVAYERTRRYLRAQAGEE
ncbi:MAG TPA: gas vesicle protein GvpO [Egibacteraceae bacterium]|nr:gas vesicle protein [Actinomycetota bacterium]HWB70799.1 gas vesicle protein GvpO [Egibacteraceae bacterium]